MRVEMSGVPGRIAEAFKKLGKFKAVALLALAGVLLILLSASGGGKKSASDAVAQPEFSLGEEEEKFAGALSKIHGAGRVTVVLTLKNGVSRSLAENSSSSFSGDEGKKQLESDTQTVVLSAGSGNEAPVTLSYAYPEYQGALVICQGAGDASVRLAVTQAVAALTGLGTDKISVVKME